jgi:FAD/FMN-containing dehydrogenase
MSTDEDFTDLVFTYDLDTDTEMKRVMATDFARNGGTLIVAKYGTNGVVTIEQTYRVEPVDEYQRAVDRERRRHEAAEREQQLAAFWSTLLGRTSGTRLPLAERAVAAVLELHSPDTDHWDSSLTCRVCDATDLDPGPWPCRTVKAIAGAYGIGVPQ